MNKNCGLGVSKHIFNCTKGIDTVHNFFIMPFYKMNKDDMYYRKAMESHFIEQFQQELNVLS